MKFERSASVAVGNDNLTSKGRARGMVCLKKYIYSESRFSQSLIGLILKKKLIDNVEKLNKNDLAIDENLISDSEKKTTPLKLNGCSLIINTQSKFHHR